VWQPCELLYTCYLLTYLLTYILSGAGFSVSEYEAQLDVALRPLIDAAKLVVTRTAHLIIAVVQLSRPCSLLHRASTSSHAAPEAARRAGPSPAAHLIIAVVLLVVAVHLASAVLRYYFRFSQYYFRLTDDAVSGLAVTTYGSFNTVAASTVITSGFSDTTFDTTSGSANTTSGRPTTHFLA